MSWMKGKSRMADDRHVRQLRLPGFGPAQQRALAQAKVAVIGAGGLGSPVLTYLAAAGVGERAAGGQITVIDPDVVESSNLHRQVIHTEAVLGTPKALSAAAAIAAQDPQIAVQPLVEAVLPDNALDLLSGHDLVIDGSDNFPTRYLVSDACEILGLPLVWGSILAWEGQLSVFDARPDAHGEREVTYRDVHPVPPRPGEVPSCAEAGVLGMLCGVIGSAMALQAVQVIARIGTPLRRRIALFDALTFSWRELPVRRAPGRAPVTELEDLTLTCGLPGASAPNTDGAVSIAELPALRAQGRRLIDIREEQELAAGMLAGAEHVPMSALLDQAQTAGEHRGLEGAVLYCASGRRSASAQHALAGLGIEVLTLAGGFEEARESGVPVRPVP